MNYRNFIYLTLFSIFFNCTQVYGMEQLATLLHPTIENIFSKMTGGWFKDTAKEKEIFANDLHQFSESTQISLEHLKTELDKYYSKKDILQGRVVIEKKKKVRENIENLRNCITKIEPDLLTKKSTRITLLDNVIRSLNDNGNLLEDTEKSIEYITRIQSFTLDRLNLNNTNSPLENSAILLNTTTNISQPINPSPKISSTADYEQIKPSWPTNITRQIEYINQLNIDHHSKIYILRILWHKCLSNQSYDSRQKIGIELIKQGASSPFYRYREDCSTPLPILSLNPQENDIVIDNLNINQDIKNLIKEEKDKISTIKKDHDLSIKREKSQNTIKKLQESINLLCSNKPISLDTINQLVKEKKLLDEELESLNKSGHQDVADKLNKANSEKEQTNINLLLPELESLEKKIKTLSTKKTPKDKQEPSLLVLITNIHKLLTSQQAKVNKNLEKLEKERLKLEALEIERIEKEKLQQQKLEELKQEQLKLEALEKERIEKEKLQLEALEKERIEKEKLQLEALEKEKIEKEKLAEQVKQLKIEQQKLEKEKIEQQKIEQEKQEILKKTLEDTLNEKDILDNSFYDLLEDQIMDQIEQDTREKETMDQIEQETKNNIYQKERNATILNIMSSLLLNVIPKQQYQTMPKEIVISEQLIKKQTEEQLNKIIAAQEKIIKYQQEELLEVNTLDTITNTYIKRANDKAEEETKLNNLLKILSKDSNINSELMNTAQQNQEKITAQREAITTKLNELNAKPTTTKIKESTITPIKKSSGYTPLICGTIGLTMLASFIIMYMYNPHLLQSTIFSMV